MSQVNCRLEVVAPADHVKMLRRFARGWGFRVYADTPYNHIKLSTGSIKAWDVFRGEVVSLLPEGSFAWYMTGVINTIPALRIRVK